jgi:LPXTG-site transpeptidase (sortase) family protein
MTDEVRPAPAVPRSSPRRGRLLLAASAGLLMVLAGVLAGVLALASDSSSQPATVEAQSLAARYQEDPGAIYDRPVITASPTPIPTPSPTPVPGPPLQDAPFRMVIERIGVDAPVSRYGLDAYLVPEVPLNAYEVAWYDFSAPPGTGSNAVFAGHVTWSGQAVFYSLNTLAPGDTVRLIGENGSQLLYTVTESYLVDPNDPSALSVMSPTQADVITIITCDGSFYYTGDPVFRGDYTNRRVVRAALTTLDVPAG